MTEEWLISYPFAARVGEGIELFARRDQRSQVTIVDGAGHQAEHGTDCGIAARVFRGGCPGFAATSAGTPTAAAQPIGWLIDTARANAEASSPAPIVLPGQCHPPTPTVTATA